jgi:NhaA family Na+:H+ antiporter
MRLLTIFFLVVGLEIKREFTVGHLAGRRSAALPVAGAVGGMLAPSVLYVLIAPAGAWLHGWGVPMATDTAFAVAVISMLGPRVPVELRIFLTAAAIVDDIGAIIVVAGFYSGKLYLGYLGAAVAMVAGLALLNYSRIYRVCRTLWSAFCFGRVCVPVACMQRWRVSYWRSSYRRGPSKSASVTRER